MASYGIYKQGVEFQKQELDIARNIQLAGLFRPKGKQNIFIALGLELIQAGSQSAGNKLRPQLLGQGRILFHRVFPDAEAGDHQPGHAAQLVALFKDSDRDTGSAQEVGCGDAGGGALDNRLRLGARWQM